MKKQFVRSALGVATAVSLVAMPGLAMATEGGAGADSTTGSGTVVTTPVNSEGGSAEGGSAEGSGAAAGGTGAGAEAGGAGTGAEAGGAGTGAGATTGGSTGNEAGAGSENGAGSQEGAGSGTTGGAASTTQPANETVILDLYNLTDIHGHIEMVEKENKKTKEKEIVEAGLPAMQCYLHEAYVTNPASSFTLLGDNIGATPFTSGALLDNPTIEALNLFPVVASTIGNHELDLGQEVFKKRVDGSAPGEFVKVGFPYLGANVDGMGTYTEAGQEVPYLDDFKIAELGGVKVAFIGAIAQDVPYKLNPSATEGLTFNDPIAKITTLAKQLKSSGQADLVVAMLDDDVKNNYPHMPAEVDVIMGGDTHVPYEFDKVNSKVKLESANPKLAGIASGSYTDNLGLVRITYNKTTKTVETADSILIPAATVYTQANQDCVANGSAAAVVKKAQAASKVAGEKVVVSGLTDGWSRGVFLAPGETQPSAGSNRGVESTLGNLVADSILDQVTIDGTTKVDIGVVNAGGLRAELTPKEGKLTYADTFKALPFSNELGFAPMTGLQFKQALENQWKSNLNSQNSRPMLRLGTSSNLTYTYDPTKPDGERITSILLNGKPLEMEKTYNVGSMTFVLQGGDGYFPKGLNVKTFGVLDREGFNAYLKKMGGANLKPSNLKRAIGISEGQAKDGIVLNLRGLSFSEGPGITKNVKVKIGNAVKTFPVNNSLLEPNASKAESIITTDGVGQATAVFSSAELCVGLSGEQLLATTISTDFGEVVPLAHDHAVMIHCGPGLKGAVTKAKLVATDTLTGTGSGFTPGGAVKVELHSKVYALGTVKADAKGNVTFNFKVPADVKPGAHHVVLIDVTTGKSVKIPVEIVKNVKTPTLPNTGVDALTLLFTAMGMLALGGGLVAARKRA